MALSVNILGVYLFPASERLGVGPGDFALWSTASGVTSMFMTSVWGRLMPGNCRACFTAGSCSLILATLMFAFSPTLPLVVVAGCFVGVALPILFTVGVPAVMGNWFAADCRGKFLGIAVSFSGLGTFLWAPVFSALIGVAGVQGAYVVNAVLVAILTLPFSVFFVRFSPEEMGLRPYGGRLKEVSDQETCSFDSCADGGMAVKDAVRTPSFWILLIAVALGACGIGYNANQVGVATEFLSASVGADKAVLTGTAMISIAAAGDMLGKVTFGVFCDRLGSRTATLLFLCFPVAAMVLWLTMPVAGVYLLASFLFGTNNAIASVGLPLVCRIAFGSRDYSRIWGRLCVASAFIGGASSSLVGYSYQFAGSYALAIMAGVVVFVAIGVCVVLVMHKSSSVQ